jgi:hypothetical protein
LGSNHPLIGCTGFDCPLQQVQPAQLLVGSLLTGSRHSEGRPSALGFGLLLRCSASAISAASTRFLRGIRLVDPLLRIPRRLLRRDSSKFEALTGDRTGAGRIRASRSRCVRCGRKGRFGVLQPSLGNLECFPSSVHLDVQRCNGPFGRFHIRADLSNSINLRTRDSDLLVGDSQRSGLCR